MVSRMPAMPKGAGWKAPMGSWVSMMSIVSRVPVIHKAMPVWVTSSGFSVAATVRLAIWGELCVGNTRGDFCATRSRRAEAAGIRE